MRYKIKLILAAGLLVLLASASGARATSYNALYMNTGGTKSALYTLTNSGDAALLGEIKVGSQYLANVYDIAFNGQNLYAITGTKLYQIDPNPVGGVVQATLVGAGFGGGSIGNGYNALAVDPVTHDLYAANNDYPGKFVKIDKTLGTATLLGDFGPKQDGNFINSVGDLAFSPAGILYAAVHWNNHGVNSRLAMVDKATGNLSLVDPCHDLGFGEVDGLSFKDGILYGVTKDHEVIRIDTTTGVGELIKADNGYNMRGLTTAPTPLPPATLLFGTGALGLLLVGWRKRKS